METEEVKMLSPLRVSKEQREFLEKEAEKHSNTIAGIQRKLINDAMKKKK